MYLPTTAPAWAWWAVPLIGFFWIPAMMAASAIASKIAASRAAKRQEDQRNNQISDVTKTTQYSTQQQAVLNALQAAEKAGLDRAQLDLIRRQFGLNATDQRMRQATRGGLLANVQDVQVSHPRANIPTITGGIRPSALGKDARDMGALVARQALMDQMKGDTFADVPGQDWTGAVLPKPGVTPGVQPTGLDTALNLIGAAGAGLGAYGAGTGTQAAAANINQYTGPSYIGQVQPWSPPQLTPIQPLPVPWNQQMPLPGG